MALLCPSCRIEMEALDYLGVPIDVCPDCAGVWFDDGELAKLSQAAPAALEALDSRLTPEFEVLNVPGSLKQCPRCTVHLRSYRYRYDSPVVIDSCPKCAGIFVEDQELEAIYHIMETEQREKVNAVVASRRMHKGRSASIGTHSLERSVATLLHALRHWREHASSP
ncbi:MAG: zf-TFIIB domain-containing protein [Fimbriimonadaceae bacterium]|nr:zf-TFIIB domain-containing protein [Chthonomonadaceae bacterium]MCO5295653.1 zf-TFIIB domain-containing protein [Fimbriimonadaceae bacterium]